MVVRAFPEHPPPGRPHVVDGWPRVPVDNYDYRPLLEVGDDVIVMDWDTAASREDLAALAAAAAATPDRIIVAPCLIYIPCGHGTSDVKWNVGNYRIAPTGSAICCAHDRLSPGKGDEASAFGFGMTYLPRAGLAAYVAANRGAILKDTLFTHWRHHAGRAPALIAWDIRPVHLHYPDAETGILAQ